MMINDALGLMLAFYVCLGREKNISSRLNDQIVGFYRVIFRG
jgi:hypothetical protein